MTAQSLKMLPMLIENEIKKHKTQSTNDTEIVSLVMESLNLPKERGLEKYISDQIQAE